MAQGTEHHTTSEREDGCEVGGFYFQCTGLRSGGAVGRGVPGILGMFIYL